MLNKLLKHEIRGTGRVIVPMLCAELLLAVMAGTSLRIMGNNAELHWTIEVIMRIVQAVFYCGLFAIFVVAFVMMIQRFFKSLMGDEGYIYMTLPVTADGHIWAKLLISAGWFIVTGIFCYIAVWLCRLMSGDIPEIYELGSLYRVLRVEYTTGRSIAMMLEFFILFVVVIFTACLHFYCAMAVGGSASAHKKLYSVIAFFVIGIIRNALTAAVTVGGIRAFIRADAIEFLRGRIDHISGESFTDIIMVSAILAVAVIGLVYYFVTRYFMTRKLNLA